MTETISEAWGVRDATQEELAELTQTVCQDDENAGPADDADNIEREA